MVIYCIKLFLLLLSLLGYIFYVQKKGIVLCFSPIIAISSLSLAMFMAGLLNIMPLAAAGLFIGGLLLFCQTVRGKHLSVSRHRSMCVFFLVAYFFFAFRLRNTQVNWYDNFSHWALVVRDMLKTNHLPNFASYLVGFQSYPTGVSGFIYYICKILDSTEGSMLFGQSLILLSCLCVLFAYADRCPGFSIAVIIMGSVYLLCICVPVTELCIDTLFSLVAIASFGIIFYYRNDRYKAWVCTAITMSLLTLAKTSGMFFVLTHCVLLLLIETQTAKSMEKSVKLRRIASLLSLSLGVPLFGYFLWNRHVDICFPAGNLSKHSLSPAYLISVFSSKNTGETSQLISNFFHRLACPGNELKVLVSFSVVFLICILWRKTKLKQSPRYDIFLFGWCVFSYVFYLVGMLGMYLFAMPYVEALKLASFDRYLYTITSYIVGITLIYLLDAVGTDMDRHHILKLATAVFVLFLVFSSPSIIRVLFRGDIITAEKQLLISAKKDYNIPDESICYITGEGDYSYLYVLSRYELWSGNLVFGDGPSPDAYSQFLQDYEYLIVVEETEAIADFLDAYSLPPDQRIYNLYALK